MRGVVVVNIFAEAIFSNIRTAAGETKKYVINQDGYFLVHPDRSKEFGFDLGFDYRITAALPEFAAEMKAQDFNVKYHTEEKHIDGFKKIFFDPGNKDRYWAVAHEIPVAQAFKNINLHRNTMLVVGLLIIVLSLVIITWTSTKKIVTPILKLSEAVNSIEKGDLAARVQEDGRHDEIGELGSSINRMAGIIEKNVNELTILNRVTVAVSSSLPAPVMATNALDAILELHLLKFEKKAALFMADEKTRTLRLVASRGLSEEQKELDAVVPFGDCLCGSAAETGEPVLSERCCDDPRHTRKYTEITPHGHLILPLKAEGKVLGVLVLYLEADTRIKPEETKFYQSIADIISMSLQNALSFSNIEGLKRHQALILDSVGEGIYGLDNSGICTFMNPTSAKLLGYEKEELIGKRLHDITHHTRPDGSVYPHEECKIYASFKDNAVYHSDDELFWRKDGSSFPVGYISTPIQDKAGNAIGAVVVFSDTTERKQAEERERNRSRILESLTSGVSLASILELIVRSIEAEDPGALCSILLLDDEGKHLLHGAAPSLPDFYSQAIHGLEIGDGVGSCGTAAFTKQRVIAADVLTHPYWADFRDLAQKANLRSCWSEPILSAEDRVLGTFAIYHRETGEPGLEDIERIKIAADFARLAIERKKAEYKIKEYAETLEIKVDERTRELNNANIELKKLFNAIEQSDESIVITDMNGSIQYVNPVFTRRTGYSREEVIGRNPRILQSGLTPVEVYDDLWKTLLSGRPWKGTLINKKKSGELYYEDATIAPVFDEQGNITNFVAAKADVTDRIMAEKELKNKNDELAMAKEEAEAANKAKSDFLANMSHELRTPLNAIIGFSEILEDGMAGPIADNQKELANDIATSGKHLLSLINDILDLSKVEAGKMELELSEFNLEELIDGSLVMFKERR
ncbi:MAG: PAS domain S-box protein [Nitrospirota bacterium]|nr:PAS domain S-box protein [Nitrospirota bacterium]